MKTRNILLSLSAALLLGACSDKLNIDQHGVLPVDEFYKTDEQVLEANAVSYYAFSIPIADFGQPFQYFYIAVNGLLSDDEWAGGNGSRGDFADGEKMNEWNFGSDNPIIEKYYGYLYAMIYRANIVLDRTTEGQSPVVDMCRAEARVFRSWANFELASFWGNAPIVDHTLATDEYQVENSKDGELVQFIIDDLKAAINSKALSKKTSVNDKDTWRITEEFAQALLGKALLLQGNNSEAITYLKAAADSPRYALFDGELADIWRMANKRNSESLFEVSRRGDPNNLVFTTVYTYYSWSTMCFVSLPEGMQPTGWGWLVPQKALYDNFESYEGHDSYRRRASILTYEEARDEHNTRIANGTTVYQDMYFPWKHRYMTEDTFGGTPIYYQNNFHIMRMAEVYLLLAEAYVRNGEADKALPYVNMIRTRAHLPELASVDLDIVKNEKRLELCFEQVRAKDLLRWGDAYDKMKNQGEGIPFITSTWASKDSTDPKSDVVTVEYRHYYTSPDQYGFKKNKNERLPYPLNEVTSNPNIVQNPGY